MLRNKSVATINAPEFINVEPYNPLISKCEIKVFYLGENRNRTYIDRETAEKIAPSLPGTPIVGVYKQELEDFGDHGEVITIKDGEVSFACETVPFGFVSPVAKIWFQDFTDTDKFGNEVNRTYLMTEGFLWTGQYKEAEAILAEGKGQSMELDGEHLSGEWATNSNSGMDFFIINDAIFSKLCILGDEVEPCFEGAAITSPEISKHFSLDQEFKATLFTMMNELKDALQNKGGSDMSQELEQFENNTSVEEEAVVTTEYTEEALADESEPVVAEEYAANEKKEDEEEKEAPASKEDKEDSQEDSADKDEDKEDEDEEKKKFSLEESVSEEPVVETQDSNDQDLVFELNQAKEELSALRAEVESLREFKLGVENAQKDELINSFYMLDDADKQDVIENKSNYTLEEIKSKLSVIYVEKNVDFSQDSQEEAVEAESAATTFSLDENVAGYISPLQEALRRTVQN